MSETALQLFVEHYGAAARSGLSSERPAVAAVAAAFGYSAAELAAIPAEANMGLSCGNPTALASLRPGEVVVDLGCGGGLDVFLAARQVGPAGKAIGIDMTEEMLALARRNAAKGPGGQPYANVEFHLATIDRLPLADRQRRLRHQQLRHQSRSRQAGRVSRDRPRAQARRAAGRERHCPEAAAAG